MSKLLIDEPPLLVLPSLAAEVGLPAAILLQQVHFAGRRQIDGWVERSVGDWHRALRGCLSKRTIERSLASLRELGWVDFEQVPGGATRYRVGAAKLADVSATSAEEGPPNRGGTVSREEEQREKPSVKGSPKKRILSLDEEPAGFVEWLEAHVAFAATVDVALSVPKHGTTYRSGLARTFAALLEEGYELEELQLASEGVLADEFMRNGGWVKPDNVLRKEKIGGRVQDGRRGRAAAEAAGGGKYDHLDGE